MKKIRYILFSLLLFVFVVSHVKAASISISPNKNSVTVGDTITVTATVSGDDADAWNYCLTYSGPISPTGGTCVTAGSITNGRSASFSFKTTASGKASFGVGDASVLAYDASDSPISKGSASVTINPKSTGVNTNTTATKNVDPPTPKVNSNASTDATLEVLYIDNFDLTPTFSKDTTEYSLDVENDVDNIVIHFRTTEDAATVSGAGRREISEGTNRIELVVTAPKGNKKTYTIVVNRAEIDPITVKINDKDYKVVRKKEEMGELLNGFTPSTTTINDKEVPTFKNEVTGNVLVGLKDENGNVSLYLYEDGKYSEYKVIVGESISLIPAEATELIVGFDKKKELEINKVNTTVYYNEDNDKLVLIYGMNTNTGEKNWYVYDTEEGTLQRYRGNLVAGEKKVESNSRDDSYKFISFIFAGITTLCLIVVLIMLIHNNKLRDKNYTLYRIVESSRKGHWENAVEQSDKEGLSSGKTGEYDVIGDTAVLDIDGDGKADFAEEDFVEEDEIDETREVKKLTPAEEKIINNIAKANDKNFNEEDDVSNKDINDTVEIDVEDVPDTAEMEKIREETMNNTIIDDVTLEQTLLRKRESNVISKKELSKRELRKLAKVQKRQEKIDLKKARLEFLEDEDFGENSAFDKYVREETETIPVVEDYKKKVKKAKKEAKKNKGSKKRK